MISNLLQPSFNHPDKHITPGIFSFSSTVVSYSNENFSLKGELPSTKTEVQQRGDGSKIGNSHLNEKLSFEYNATVNFCSETFPVTEFCLKASSGFQGLVV